MTNDIHAAPFAVGDRVRLIMALDIWNLGSFPEGATGTVTYVGEQQVDGVIAGEVKLDQHFPDLDEWENVLQIARDSEVTWAVWAPAAIPRYRTAFPTFPDADWPAPLPDGFVDVSWRNDCCPSLWSDSKRLVIWVDYADPAKSEVLNPSGDGDFDPADHQRFAVFPSDEAGGTLGDKPLLATSDWNAVLAFIASGAAEFVPCPHCGERLYRAAEIASGIDGDGDAIETSPQQWQCGACGSWNDRPPAEAAAG